MNDTEEEEIAIVEPVKRRFGGAQPGAGRPSCRTIENEELIISRITLGQSLAEICRSDDAPAISSVIDWLCEDERFAARYARAKESQIELEMDALLNLADETPKMIVAEDGSERVDPGWVAWRKSQIDTRKWIASKLKPKKYGDTGNNVNVAVGVSVNAISEEERGKIMEKKREAIERRKAAKARAIEDAKKVEESGG